MSIPGTLTATQCSLAAPVNLRCEHEINPLGLKTENPWLSWELEGLQRGAAPIAYQILAARSVENLHLAAAPHDLLWNSDTVKSTATHAIYQGKRSGWWKVRVWDQNGIVSSWSAPAYFEYYLGRSGSEWITAGDRDAAPHFRAEFPVPLSIKRARAYFSGLGYGELYINGTRVGEDQLSPGWTDFDKREYRDMLYPYEDNGRKRVLYRTYDVTSLLQVGTNAVGCILGNGMHQQRVRIIEGKMWYGPPRLNLELFIELSDGSHLHVNSLPSDKPHWYTEGDPFSDELAAESANRVGFTTSEVEKGRWRWTEGPIVINNVFTGEICDARRALPDNWCLPGFDDSAWQPALKASTPEGARENYRPQLCPSDTVVATLPPIASREPAPGVHVLDFGRVISGWVKLSVAGPAGTTVVLRFTENINDQGLPDFRSAGADHIQQDAFVLAGTGAPETWEPRFVWHGFRYVEITRWPTDSTPPSAANVEAKEIYVNTPGSSDFECSHLLLNKIVKLFHDTQLANQHGGVPSDCPHRERLGYTGDAQITAEAVMWNFDVRSFYAKWIDDIFDAQNATSGFVPHTVPFYGGGGGPGWGSACIIIPWTYYQFYGDRRILAHNYDGMVAWFNYLKRHTDERGLVTHEEPGSWCLGDWAFPTLTPGTFDKMPNVAIELVNTYYYGECAVLLERIATALGKSADAEHFAAELAQIRHNFHAAFYDPASGSYGAGIGGSNAFALLLDAGNTEIVTEADADIAESPDRIRTRAAKALQHHAPNRDTGIFGTPIVLEALMRNGLDKVAYDIMTATSYPSFGYMLANGATTIWESWSGTYGTHCHPMFGSVAAWMPRWVAGLSQDTDSVGFKKIVWRPWPGPEITWARLNFHSVRGWIRLDWRRIANTLHANIEIPPGTTATIKLQLPEPIPHPILRLDGVEVSLQEGDTRVHEAWKEETDTTTEVTISIASGKYAFMLSPT